MINLLRVSLGGTFLILLLGIVRHFKFFSRKQVAFLWTLVMIRLLIVFSIPSVLWISIAPTSPLNSLGIVEENKIPVKFIGVGEQMEDMEIFNSEEFVKAII